MQEEIEHKTVNLAISTTKLSARTLLRGMQFLLRQYDKHASQGKQSMKRLVRQNRGVTNVEIQRTGIKDSDFVYMLNQANGDRQILAKQLNISPHQLSYVTHSGEGEGLLFFGNVILPFVDHFPKDLELYRILTTRLSEVAEAQKHE